MIEKMTETKNGAGRGSWRRAFSGTVATVVAATTIAGCGETIKTAVVDPTPTLEASPISGTGEFSTLFTPNSLQNLDSEAKAIVSKNLELINQECKKDLPGMVEGSEKYLYSRNISNDIFVWGFCDVKADANGPERTVVSMFDWMAGPAGETTKIYRDLMLFDDGTLGYVDTDGNSHAVMKKAESNLVDVYDINENVVASQPMTPELTSFMSKALLMPPQIEPTITNEQTATVEPTVEANIEGISSIEEIQTRIDDYISGKEDWSVTGPNKDYLFVAYETMPLSYFTISEVGGPPEYFTSCKQQGVYLGSYISDSDNSIIVVFGSQNANKQSIIEMFTVGFSVKPDDLPEVPMVSYVLQNDKSPSWSMDVKERITGSEVPSLLKEKENQIIMWEWVCKQENPELVSALIAEVAQQGRAGESQKTLEWFFEKSRATEGLLDWLNDPGIGVPYGVFTNAKEVDLKNIDAKKLPPIFDLRIPGNINK